MRPGAVSPAFTVEARAERLQRRHTGPWRTVAHEAGPFVLTTRYRRRRRIESVRLGVALRDLERAIWASLLPALMLPIRLLSRR